MPERRESWTDGRLDDLSNRVDAGFARMEDKFDRLDAKLDAKFERVDDKFHSLYRLMIVVGSGMIGTLIASCAAVIATHA